MKTIKIIILVLLAHTARCQDKIYLHTGKRLDAKITQVGENSILYAYPGESAVNSIGRAAVEKVEFSSGRSESISRKISINGKDGWENVIITNNPNDVIGLTRLGEIKAKAGGYWSMRTTKGSDRKATERIKKEAAELGGHVVYLQQHETTGRKAYSNPESIQSGVAYGY